LLRSRALPGVPSSSLWVALVRGVQVFVVYAQPMFAPFVASRVAMGP
jgi:hypothetical protein